jgi:hypothetical protein
LSTEAERGSTAARSPRSWGGLLVVISADGLAWAGTLLPPPLGPADRAALAAVTWFAPAVVLVVVLAWAAWLACLAWQTHHCGVQPELSDREEPLLGPSHVMPCRSPRPVVVLAGLGSGAGVSTLAFNLAVTLAVAGRVPDGQGARPCRPICLLDDCALSGALGLSPQPLEDYLAAHPHRVDADLVNLAVHHPTGCELLCIGSDGRAAGSMQRIVAELSQQYDAMFVDEWRGERHVVDVVSEFADALLLVAGPAADCVQVTGAWIELVWAHGLEGRTALLLNRVAAWPRPPRELDLAFLYGAEIPDDPAAADLDRDGLPWSLDHRLAASRRLIEVAAQLLPALMPGAGAHAA